MKSVSIFTDDEKVKSSAYLVYAISFALHNSCSSSSNCWHIKFDIAGEEGAPMGNFLVCSEQR